MNKSINQSINQSIERYADRHVAQTKQWTEKSEKCGTNYAKCEKEVFF